MAASVRTEPTPLPTTGDPFRDLQRDVETREAALAVASVWADPDEPAEEGPVLDSAGRDLFDAVDAEPEPDEDGLEECDVLLSDGRIARLYKTYGNHDMKLGRMLARWGITVQAVGADTFAEVKALMCLENLRQKGEPPEKAKPFRTPTSTNALEFAMGQFRTPDLMKLVMHYARVNLGMETEDNGSGGFRR